MSSPEEVQWTFLQYDKKGGIFSKKNKAPRPAECFLHTQIRIGSSLLSFGGTNNKGEQLSSLFLYDTDKYCFYTPIDDADFQEDHPQNRSGHSMVLIDHHPPRLVVWGGVTGGDAYQFGTLDSGMYDVGLSGSKGRSKVGKANDSLTSSEDFDDRIYFLELRSEHWEWSKPLITTALKDRPDARTDHTCVKTAAYEIMIFGGWSSEGPMNDCWSFNTQDMEWNHIVPSGIQPKPRFRHTCEIIGSLMIVLGGANDGEESHKNGSLGGTGVSVLDLNSMQWSHPEIQGQSPFPRSGHCSTCIGNSIILFGGRNGANWHNFKNDTYVLDISPLQKGAKHISGTWVNAVQSQLPTAVTGATLSAVGNRCFLFGGVDSHGKCYNDIRKLDVSPYLDTDDSLVDFQFLNGTSADYTFKILIIGDSGVGKTSLLQRFSDGAFTDETSPTIGVDYATKLLKVEKSIAQLEIWDTAGQERFSTLTANYYRGAQGVLLVYDVGSRSSFVHVQKWLDRAIQLGGEHLIPVLVGNKSDLGTGGSSGSSTSNGGVDLLDFDGVSTPVSNDDTGGGREVSNSEGQDLATALGEIDFIETSAKNGQGVEQAFVRLAGAIKNSVDARGLKTLKGKLVGAGGVSLAKGERKERNCC